MVELGEIEPTEETLRQWWEQVKESLLEEFIQDHPGERPAAWWRFDKPAEPFLIVGKYCFPPYDDIEESHFDYLVRNGLLTDNEIEIRRSRSIAV